MNAKNNFLKYGTRAVLLLFLIHTAGFVSAQQKPQPLNIVFLFADDLGMPDLGVYGNQAIHTPNLDRLAKESVLFTRAYVTSPQCSPSRASILTGRSPHVVGASRLHVDAQKEFTSVIQLLKQGGYYTGAYRKVHQEHIEAQFDYKGDKDLTAFFSKRPADKPFFLWFGSTDPHRPYQSGTYSYQHDPQKLSVPDYLPDTKAVREDLANYYNEITRFDKECGEILQLLDKNNLSENTIVVVSSDNGKPFPRAKSTLYESGIHIPLIVKWPGISKAGSKRDELVSLLDLTPTWLDGAGLPVPVEMEGNSLRSLLRGNVGKSREYLFSERNWHDNWDPMRSVVSKRYKLIQNYRPEAPWLSTLDRLYSPAWEEYEKLKNQGQLGKKLQWFFAASKPETEFYDLENDPGEWNNLARDPAYQTLVMQHQSALAKWMNDTHDFLPAPGRSFPEKSKFDEKYDPLNAGKIKNKK